jgi:Cytochrome P450
MLAGHETSANTLSWSLALLSAYPSARQQLEAELDAVLGDRDPDAGDADKLPWTRAIVAEAMRLYPPAFLPDGGASPYEHDDGQHRHRYAYIPFGGGRRACVGASFAELETGYLTEHNYRTQPRVLGPAGEARQAAKTSRRRHTNRRRRSGRQRPGRLSPRMPGGLRPCAAPAGPAGPAWRRPPRPQRGRMPQRCAGLGAGSR